MDIGYTAAQKRYWVRHVGVAIATALSYLFIAGGGTWPPDPNVVYQAFGQGALNFFGSFGITAATQTKK